MTHFLILVQNSAIQQLIMEFILISLGTGIVQNDALHPHRVLFGTSQQNVANLKPNEFRAEKENGIYQPCV